MLRSLASVQKERRALVYTVDETGKHIGAPPVMPEKWNLLLPIM